MALRIVGERRPTGERDEKGYRTYTITYLLQSDDGLDGPANVMQTPGLPIPGAYWLLNNDVDVWVWCRPNVRIKPVQPLEDGPITVWEAEFTFSNKPLESNKCEDQQVDDPLLEPPSISGQFEKYTEEATHDRFGKKIKNSAHEEIHGPQNEWDTTRGCIQISQNVVNLQLPLLIYINNTVNDAPLWGLPARWIKCTVEPWEEVYHGQCYKYYKRSFSFQIKHGGWDRDLRDQGTKVLNGHWGADSGSGLTVDISVSVGTGCTLNITTAGDGSVTTAEVSSGGSGYPVNSLITLNVIAGSGVGAKVEAVTDGSGIVTRVLHPIVNAGSDYQDGSATTSFGGDSGAITSVTLSDGGTGYPASSKFNVNVISGVGYGGVITVKTGAGGVVETVTLVSGGRGYVDATANTSNISGWLLDNINGATPDARNPAHFIRFKDRQGENSVVVLDGAGCPAPKPEDAGKVHVEKFDSANFLLLGIPTVIGP